MRMLRTMVLAGVLFGQTILAQQDTTSFQWPCPGPAGTLHESQYLNATFSEFRNTLTSNHFHSGVDIGEPDGNPIYSCLDGVVYSIGTSATSGTSAYVRVKSLVSGGWKHISYVHIEPAPGITAGVPVTAGVTVLGTVLNGQGHVHLTERELSILENGNGVEMNAVRTGGGLTPFDDFWSPLFSEPTLQFRRSGTRSVVSPGQLFGKIDIVVRINERNSPESVGGTRTNNGAYAAGFRILTADSQQTVFEPPDAGLRYRFDRMPSNTYVGNVFDEALSTTSAHYYSLTNGAGAGTVSNTRVVSQNFLDVGQIPPGDYILQLFTFDTRQNRTDWYVPVHITDQDLSPPERPTLLSAIPDGEDIDITWLPPSDPDLHGFRLFVSSDLGGNFTVPETTLTKSTTSFKLRLPADFPTSEGGLPRVQVRLTAVDTVTPPNESPVSDTYVATPGIWGETTPSARFLIVDGFDRYGGSGSWGSPVHTFAVSASSPYPLNVAVGTAANELVEGGIVSLSSGWGLVHWILGDESTVDNTLTSAEQFRIRQYLESGGSLFISGSEIGWDLGRTHNLSEPGDLSFYNNYLKALYVFDGNSTMTTATGVSGTPFQGYTWSFGTAFPEDYPDDIEPTGGAVSVLTYNAQRDAQTPRKAGVGFIGAFGQSTSTGRLVHLAFPFESIVSPFQREVLFQKATEFMGVITGIHGRSGVDIPMTTRLHQNYPNPFNPTTRIQYSVSDDGRPSNVDSHVRLSVFDLLGREVAVLVNEERSPGEYTAHWNAQGLASGVYLIRLEAGRTVLTRTALLLK